MALKVNDYSLSRNDNLLTVDIDKTTWTHIGHTIMLFCLFLDVSCTGRLVALLVDLLQILHIQLHKSHFLVFMAWRGKCEIFANIVFFFNNTSEGYNCSYLFTDLVLLLFIYFLNFSAPLLLQISFENLILNVNDFLIFLPTLS